MPIERFRPWKSEVPLIFVLLSLVSLIVVPVLVQRRTTAVREEFIRDLNPARAKLIEIQRQLALEAEGTLGYLFTGETRFAQAREQARALRMQEYTELLALARVLGPAVYEPVVLLRHQLQPVDALRDSLYEGALSRSVYLSRLSAQQARFREVMSTVTQVNRAIDQAAAIRRNEMRSMESVANLLTVCLAGLALLSGLIVAKLGRKYRSLAQELDTRQAKLTAILESITDAFFALDRDWRFTFVNREAERVMTVPRQELLGKVLWDYPQTKGTIYEREFRRAMGEQHTVEFEEFVPPLGIWADVRVYPSADGLSVYFRDVTERVKIAAEREQLLAREREARVIAEESREEVNRVIQSRSKLVRGFSHDVKNPLGAADGYLQLLEEEIIGPLTGRQKESVGRARSSIRAALDLISDMLALARAESGELRTDHEVMDVTNVVKECVDESRMQADEKGLNLTLEIEHELPSIQSDPARVRQVLTNLLSNAVKYTEQGSVTVAVARRDRVYAPGGHHWVAIEVRDTGPGLSEEEQKGVFEEFRRFGTAGQQPGSGIGLAMSYHIARALKGDLTVESQPGRGSTFTFWLPIE